MNAPAPVVRSPIEVNFTPPEAVVRFGMIALATDLTSERDAARLIPRDRAALHVTRVAYENPSTPENLRKMGPKLTAAAELLAPVPALAAICYSCTAASVEIGDQAVAEAINDACPGVPVVTPSSARSVCAGSRWSPPIWCRRRRPWPPILPGAGWKSSAPIASVSPTTAIWPV
jgi:hypothetical protein